MHHFQIKQGGIHRRCSNHFIEFNIFLIFWLLNITIYGNGNQKRNFKHFSAEDGLLGNSVNCVAQDSKGFMWFGTLEGVSRFDGYKYKNYQFAPNDSTSLPGQIGRTILEDKHGNLWIGTDGGLCLYNRDKDCFIRYPCEYDKLKKTNTNSVWILYEDRRGNLWVGRAEAGLDLFNRDDGSITRFQHQSGNNQSISDNFITSILEDCKGNLWIGTKYGGLNLFDREAGIFTSYKHNSENSLSLISDRITSLCEDNNGTIWVGTSNAGLCAFNLGKKTFLNFQQGIGRNTINNNNVRTILEAEKDILWIGTDGGGLNFFDLKHNKFTYAAYDQLSKGSIGSDVISTIFKDKKGLIWIGTFQGGGNIFKTPYFGLYNKVSTEKYGLSYKSVSCIYQDPDDNIWLGTDGGGLDQFDRSKETFKHFKHDPSNNNSLSGDAIMCITRDYKGYYWIGTWGNGLNRFDIKSNSFVHYKHNPNNRNSLSSNNVISVYEDNRKNLWIGLIDGGLELYDRTNDNFIHFEDGKIDNSIGSVTNIITMLEDSKGNFWIGSLGGLFRFNRKTGTFNPYLNDPNDRNSISNNSILAIFEDSKGSIWIGTDKGGLNLLTDVDRKTFKVFLQNPKRLHNKINGILEDDLGNLWLSTNDGLSKFNTRNGNFRDYSIEDGLQSNEFNYKSCLKSSSGEMYFGGINGFNSFYPDSIKENGDIPAVVITEFSILNKPISIDEKVNGNIVLEKSITEIKDIELSYLDEMFSFEFAVLDYIAPEKNKYAYMMEGFEKNWNYVENRRYATYSNLPSGNYVLKVKGANSSGIWNNDGISIRIKIKPPYWATWWFRSFLILIIFASVLAAHKFRLKKIQSLNDNLEKLVNQKTKDLININSHLERTKNELAIEKEELSITLKSIADGVITTNVKGKILFANETAESILEQSNAELLFNSIYEKIKFKDEAKYNVPSDKSKISVGNFLKNLENETVGIILPGNKTKLLQIISSDILTQQNESRGYVIILRDVTEKIQVTNQLRVSQKMESIGNLAAGIAHEINTPMQFVGDNTSFLKETFNAFITFVNSVQLEVAKANGSPSELILAKIKEIKKNLDIDFLIGEIPLAIEQSQIGIEKVSNIVKAMKDFAHPGSKEKAFSNINHNIEVTSTISKSEWKYVAELEINLDPDLPNIYCLQDELNQVILNMIVNAAHAIEEKINKESGEKGKIIISTKREDNFVVITISDTGKGIKEENLDKIFDPFFTTKQVGKGTGQGLSIAHNIIVNKHKGSISVESVIDKGTIFRIKIPIIEDGKQSD